MLKKALITATILALVSTATATQLQVEDVNINQPIHGGETLQKDVTVSWSGDTSTVAYLESNVDAENTNVQGIYVSYINNPLVVPSNGETTTSMVIKADYYLKPDNFTITTTASTEVEKEIEYRYSEEEVYKVKGDLNSTEETYLRNRLNSTVERNQMLEERIDYLNEKVSRLESLITENNTEPDQPVDRNQTNGNESGNQTEEKSDEEPDETGFFQGLIRSITSIFR